MPLIAVIDDDKDFRTSLCELVQSAGLRASAFSTAESFLKSLTLEEADCIVCDFQIPGHIDGLQLLRILQESGQATPLILMSAFGDETLHRRARAEGAHCFLEKPFMIEALLQCISSATKADFQS